MNFPAISQLFQYPIISNISIVFAGISQRCNRVGDPQVRARATTGSEESWSGAERGAFFKSRQEPTGLPGRLQHVTTVFKHYPWTSKTRAEREISESTRKLSEKTQYFLQHLLSCSTTGHPQRCSLGKPGSVHNCRYYCAI